MPATEGTGSDVLLSVSDLTVTFQTDDGPVRAVDGVSFSIGRGERLGVVGESGSGKSLSGLSLLGLVSGRGACVEGRMVFDGAEYDLSSPELRNLRGREISMIFQEPMTALDPVFTIGSQISTVLRHHRRLGRKDARTAALEALRDVGIPDPARRADEYPHQLSGGMRQRAMIALAISCNPKLLVADEPTTALDVTTQAQILELLRELSDTRGMAVMLVSHDLGVVTELCERLLCVYAGHVVQEDGTEDALTRPRHPYLSGLLRSMPRAGARGQRLFAIPGTVPPPGHTPAGCRFQPRCEHAGPGCELPQTLAPAGGHSWVRCHRHAELLLPGVNEIEGAGTTP